MGFIRNMIFGKNFEKDMLESSYNFANFIINLCRQKKDRFEIYRYIYPNILGKLISCVNRPDKYRYKRIGEILLNSKNEPDLIDLIEIYGYLSHVGSNIDFDDFSEHNYNFYKNLEDNMIINGVPQDFFISSNINLIYGDTQIKSYIKNLCNDANYKPYLIELCGKLDILSDNKEIEKIISCKYCSKKLKIHGKNKGYVNCPQCNNRFLYDFDK